MRKSRIRNSFVPIVYGAIVVVFLFGMYFAQKFAKDLLFKNNDRLRYVDG